MFCNKADKWIDSCVANKNFEERKELLQSEIFPFFTEFGVCFNKEENIKHLSKTVDVKEAIEICIGEIPYQLLLDYYSHYKIIDNDALAQIKISQEKDERYNNRWPVLFYRSVATNSSVMMY